MSIFQNSSNYSDPFVYDFWSEEIWKVDGDAVKEAFPFLTVLGKEIPKSTSIPEALAIMQGVLCVDFVDKAFFANESLGIDTFSVLNGLNKLLEAILSKHIFASQLIPQAQAPLTALQGQLAGAALIAKDFAAAYESGKEADEEGRRHLVHACALACQQRLECQKVLLIPGGWYKDKVFQNIWYRIDLKNEELTYFSTNDDSWRYQKSGMFTEKDKVNGELVEIEKECGRQRFRIARDKLCDSATLELIIEAILFSQWESLKIHARQLYQGLPGYLGAVKVDDGADYRLSYLEEKRCHNALMRIMNGLASVVYYTLLDALPFSYSNPTTYQQYRHLMGFFSLLSLIKSLEDKPWSYPTCCFVKEAAGALLRHLWEEKDLFSEEFTSSLQGAYGEVEALHAKHAKIALKAKVAPRPLQFENKSLSNNIINAFKRLNDKEVREKGSKSSNKENIREITIEEVPEFLLRQSSSLPLDASLPARLSTLAAHLNKLSPGLTSFLCDNVIALIPLPAACLSLPQETRLPTIVALLDIMEAISRNHFPQLCRFPSAVVVLYSCYAAIDALARSNAAAELELLPQASPFMEIFFYEGKVTCSPLALERAEKLILYFNPKFTLEQLSDPGRKEALIKRWEMTPFALIQRLSVFGYNKDHFEMLQIDAGSLYSHPTLRYLCHRLKNSITDGETLEGCVARAVAHPEEFVPGALTPELPALMRASLLSLFYWYKDVSFRYLPASKVYIITDCYDIPALFINHNMPSSTITENQFIHFGAKDKERFVSCDAYSSLNCIISLFLNSDVIFANNSLLLQQFCRTICKPFHLRYFLANTKNGPPLLKHCWKICLDLALSFSKVQTEMELPLLRDAFHVLTFFGVDIEDVDLWKRVQGAPNLENREMRCHLGVMACLNEMLAGNAEAVGRALSDIIALILLKRLRGVAYSETPVASVVLSLALPLLREPSLSRDNILNRALALAGKELPLESHWQGHYPALECFPYRLDSKDIILYHHCEGEWKPMMFPARLFKKPLARQLLQGEGSAAVLHCLSPGRYRDPASGVIIDIQEKIAFFLGNKRYDKKLINKFQRLCPLKAPKQKMIECWRDASQELAGLHFVVKDKRGGRRFFTQPPMSFSITDCANGAEWIDPYSIPIPAIQRLVKSGEAVECWRTNGSIALNFVNLGLSFLQDGEKLWCQEFSNFYLIDAEELAPLVSELCALALSNGKGQYTLLLSTRTIESQWQWTNGQPYKLLNHQGTAKLSDLIELGQWYIYNSNNGKNWEAADTKSKWALCLLYAALWRYAEVADILKDIMKDPLTLYRLAPKAMLKKLKDQLLKEINHSASALLLKLAAFTRRINLAYPHLSYDLFSGSAEVFNLYVEYQKKHLSQDYILEAEEEWLILQWLREDQERHKSASVSQDELQLIHELQTKPPANNRPSEQEVELKQKLAGLKKESLQAVFTSSVSRYSRKYHEKRWHYLTKGADEGDSAYVLSPSSKLDYSQLSFEAFKELFSNTNVIALEGASYLLAIHWMDRQSFIHHFGTFYLIARTGTPSQRSQLLKLLRLNCHIAECETRYLSIIAASPWRFPCYSDLFTSSGVRDEEKLLALYRSLQPSALLRFLKNSAQAAQWVYKSLFPSAFSSPLTVEEYSGPVCAKARISSIALCSDGAASLDHSFSMKLKVMCEGAIDLIPTQPIEQKLPLVKASSPLYHALEEQKKALKSFYKEVKEFTARPKSLDALNGLCLELNKQCSFLNATEKTVSKALVKKLNASITPEGKLLRCRLTLKDLLAAMLKKKDLPIDASALLQLVSGYCKLLVLQSRLQQMTKACTLLKSYLMDSDGKQGLLTDTALLLTQQRAYTLSKENIHYLAFEVALGYLMRQDQIDKIHEQCSLGKDPATVLIQMRTGWGKNSVFAPAILYHKGDGETLTFFASPPTHELIHAQQLFNIMGEGFARHVDRWDFSCRAPHTPATIGYLWAALKQNISNKTPICCSPQTLQATRLYLLVLLREIAQDKLPYSSDKALMAMLLIKIERAKRLFGWCLTDEVHLMTPYDKLIFALGSPLPYPAERLPLMEKIIGQLLSLPQLGLRQNKCKEYLLEYGYDSIALSLVDEWADYFCIPSEEKDSFSRYIRGKTKERPLALKSLSFDTEESLHLVRGVISRVLEFSLSGYVGVDFGPSKSDFRIDHVIAIPYSASETPKEDSQYQNIDETYLKTALTLLHRGLQKKELDKLLELMKRLCSAQAKVAATSLEETEAYQLYARVMKGIASPAPLYQVNHTSWERMHHRFAHDKEAILFYMRYHVAEQITYYPKSIASTSQNYISQFASTLGMSATPPDKEIHSGSVHFIPMRSHTGAMTHLLLIKTKTIHIDDKKTAGETLDSALDIVCESKRLSALIDSGALLAGFDAEKASKAIYEKLKDKKLFEGVVYFDETKKLFTFLSFDTATNSILGNNDSSKGRPFHLFDHPRTYSSDCAVGDKDDGLVTVSLEMTLDAAAQGAGRLRRLHADQGLEWLVPRSVAQRAFADLAHPTAMELYLFALENGRLCTSRALAEALKQRMEDDVNCGILDEILGIDAVPTDEKIEMRLEHPVDLKRAVACVKESEPWFFKDSHGSSTLAYGAIGPDEPCFTVLKAEKDRCYAAAQGLQCLTKKRKDLLLSRLQKQESLWPTLDLPAFLPGSENTLGLAVQVETQVALTAQVQPQELKVPPPLRHHVAWGKGDYFTQVWAKPSAFPGQSLIARSIGLLRPSLRDSRGVLSQFLMIKETMLLTSMTIVYGLVSRIFFNPVPAISLSSIIVSITFSMVGIVAARVALWAAVSPFVAGGGNRPFSPRLYHIGDLVAAAVPRRLSRVGSVFSERFLATENFCHAYCPVEEGSPQKLFSREHKFLFQLLLVRDCNDGTLTAIAIDRGDSAQLHALLEEDRLSSSRAVGRRFHLFIYDLASGEIIAEGENSMSIVEKKALMSNPQFLEFLVDARMVDCEIFASHEYTMRRILAAKAAHAGQEAFTALWRDYILAHSPEKWRIFSKYSWHINRKD